MLLSFFPAFRTREALVEALNSTKMSPNHSPIVAGILIDSVEARSYSYLELEKFEIVAVIQHPTMHGILVRSENGNMTSCFETVVRKERRNAMIADAETSGVIPVINNRFVPPLTQARIQGGGGGGKGALAPPTKSWIRLCNVTILFSRQKLHTQIQNRGNNVHHI